MTGKQACLIRKLTMRGNNSEQAVNLTNVDFWEKEVQPLVARKTEAPRGGQTSQTCR